MTKTAYSRCIERLGKLHAPMEMEQDIITEMHDVYELSYGSTNVIYGNVFGLFVLSREGD
jgi:hypothetical protein